MYICNVTRERILELLPKGGEAAEIGVAEGTFSREIVRRVQPDRLHLIDPWEFQELPDWHKDNWGNVPADEQDQRYLAVKAAFARESEAGQVVLHRSYSTAAATTFADHQFDWIYLDALHTRDAVFEDLMTYKDKVKRDGFILGHDYTNHVFAQEKGFGVIEAVNEFCATQGFGFLILTMENYPSYVLTPDVESEAAQQMVLRTMHDAPHVLELRDYPGRFGLQHKAIQIAGKPVVYYSLG